MEQSYKLLVATLIVGAGLGSFLTYKLSPVREVTKTETKEVDKDHVVTHVVEVTKPDGTKTTDTTIINDSTINKDMTSIQLSLPPKPSQWFVSVGLSKTSLLSDNIYQLSINKRVLGPLFLGVNGSSTSSFDNKQLGLSLGMEF